MAAKAEAKIRLVNIFGKASAVTGYYLREGMPHDHDAKPDFCAIDENNLLAGENRDHASQFGQPQPWEKGSFHWMIPNEFRADEDAIRP